MQSGNISKSHPQINGIMIKIIEVELCNNYFWSNKEDRMENIKHIHEVLNLLFNTETEYTVDKLYAELRSQFGDDVHFANCADNVFPIEEVVSFLLSKNKIRLSENTIIPLTPACSH